MKELNIKELVKAMKPFLARWHEVETAPRWQCPVCQFEQNRFYSSHAPGCSNDDSAKSAAL